MRQKKLSYPLSSPYFRVIICFLVYSLSWIPWISFLQTIGIFDDKGVLVIIVAPAALPIALIIITVLDLLLKRIKFLKERTDIFFGIELIISSLLFYPCLILGYGAVGMFCTIFNC